MKCPHCKKPIKIDPKVFINAATYNNNLLVNTQCCKKPVNVIPYTNFDIIPYTGERTTDDWNQPILNTLNHENI